MKNYKKALLTSLSIIALTNFNITKSNDSAWHRLFNALADLFPASKYENHLNQLRSDLQGLPARDIDSIVWIAQQKLTVKKPENEYHINQLMRDAIVDQVRTITIDMAKRYTNNQEEIDASVRSMVGNVRVRLNQGENLNGLALKQFFDRDSLKRLVLQNVKDPYNRQTTYSMPSTYSSYSSQSMQKPNPIPSTSTVYRPSNEDFLRQIRHELKGIPETDINAIIAASRQEFLRKKPTNDYTKNSIVREVITNRVRMNARSAVSRFTNNTTLIDSTVQSMSNNVKARLARGDNLNGQALQQFFGLSLERMIKQNIDARNASNANNPAPLPNQYAPSAPSASAEETLECCICLDDFEKTALQNIPCINLHTDQICPTYASGLTNCPLCRGKLIK